MMSSTRTPSARAAKLSAMRWRNTGLASSMTSSIEGARRPSSSARARTAIISDWLARGPGPQATWPRISGNSLSSGRPMRTSARIASTTLSPTGIRRTTRWAANNSSAVITGTASASSTPVVAINMWRSASRSG